MTDRSGRPRDPLPTSVDALPELPPAYHGALDAGLASLRLSLTPGARAMIEGHVRLLLAWMPSINLTSLRDPAQIAVRHVVDSLSALPVLDGVGADVLVDLGSGAGFPGLPLAAARPGLRAVLVESIGKKARFLATAVEAVRAGGRIDVVAERAEAFARQPGQRGRWPVVTARAVGDLAELSELAFPLLRIGGCLVAWKRGEVAAEVAAARQLLPRLGGGVVEVLTVGSPLLPEHRLVVVTKRGPTAEEFPRDPGVRKRRGR